jgi:hypothetical protein
MTMDRHNCYRWLHVSVNDDNLSLATIQITHHQPHHPYTDILVTAEVGDIVDKLKNLMAAKVRVFTCLLGSLHDCLISE